MVAVDEITSTLTAHRATRCPGGWAVTWLGDRTVTLAQACDAIDLAGLIENVDLRLSRLDTTTYDRITALAHGLGIRVGEAIRLIQRHPLSKPLIYDPVTGCIRDEQPATQQKETEMAKKPIDLNPAQEAKLLAESMNDRGDEYMELLERMHAQGCCGCKNCG